MKKLLLITIMLAIWQGSPLPAQTTNISVAPKILQSYVGQYELAPGFVLIVRQEGEGLTAQATGQPRIRLTARSETEFEARSANASLNFEKDKDGKVTKLVLHQNGDHDAPKISSEVPKERVAIQVNPKIYDAYAGQYELESGAVMTVRRDGDKLRAQLADQPGFQVFPESETEFFYKVVDAQLTFVKDQNGKVTELVLHQNGDKRAKKTSDQVPPVKKPDLSKIPARDPKAQPQQVDLTGKYTSPLTEQWHPDVAGLPPGGNHLGSVPLGVQKLGEVKFEVRGVIQLTGIQAEYAGADFAEAQNGIKIARKCKKLHFLHATGWRAEDGTTVGKYVLHYAGGQQAVLNVVYGVDARDWWASSDEAKNTKSATVAWSGSNPAAEGVGGSIRLYKRTYENPKPDLVVETMDFVSSQADAAPFLVAVTVED